ncbi:peptide/nickel transport system ATP-binding protein [Leucobacter komagatae]|uniref:Peptide/nickel transport system ATP-binding protein n=1 Tax=Leucobacter komagatae TaxID=55969 RepID=A0A542Y8K0_9MICO|nr:ATP-binding cassette domain-containing protein [Leucobacter komagatae]TQL44411.1 peptide/nickel transport system ATP-binding protein [Leucobacter komagatae]
MTAPILSASALGMHYPGARTPALTEVDLAIRAGGHLGIIGESGSGKSTLARLLLGLQRPSSGSVQFRGEPIPTGRGRSAREFRRAVQVVLQDPVASLSPRMTVGGIIAEPVRALRPEWNERERVAELLAAVDLPADVAQRLPRELSGGQRQRVAIARALSVRPEVVIADEPVSALDVSVRAQVLQLLRRLAAHEGLTVVVVSHDLGIIDGLCTEAAVMQRGQIVEHGPTRQILDDPVHPYTRELIASVPTLPYRSTHP